MQNILVVSGHTDLNNSVANKAILERLENKLPQAEFVYLDKLYSDFQIDVEAEQEKLLKAMCNLCGLDYFGYVYTGGVSYQNRNDIEKMAEMKEKAVMHADKLLELLETL